jgi:hypothetical protein
MVKEMKEALVLVPCSGWQIHTYLREQFLNRLSQIDMTLLAAALAGAPTQVLPSFLRPSFQTLF